MRRALYLDGGDPALNVTIEGPALRIRREGRADGRAPLRQLSRIVVRGRVSWQTEALLACMDADIPITFVAADGRARGWCVGVGGLEDDINEMLDECVLRRDWPDRQENWIRAMERRALLACLGDAHASPPQCLRTIDAWVAMETHLDRLRSPVVSSVIMATLSGALEAHLATLLRTAGVASRFAVGREGPVRLIADFRRVLVWELWPIAERSALYFCRHGEKHRRERDVRRRLVKHYEAAAPAIEKRFRELFWRFRLHLQGLTS